MARPESVASGGYFPTPDHLIPLIADALICPEENTEVKFVDPCAGEGRAIIALSEKFEDKVLHVCELEKQRYDQLVSNLYASKNHSSAREALFGDAFQIVMTSETNSLIFLNPPYDLDRVHGRLEEKFLERFTPTLVFYGILIFVVPHYALKASAETLATEYTDLQCFRFPDPDFEAYSQVVLFARKSDTLPVPDPKIVRQVEAWAASVEGMPELGECEEHYRVPEHSHKYESKCWEMSSIDLTGLLRKVRPWFSSGRSGTYNPVPHIIPDTPVGDLMFRTFPLATSPRPAHIAAGIASGLFNGRRVVHKDGLMPDLLVKGVFDREYVTIKEKIDKDGIVSSVVQAQQPKLVTTVLDLESKRYTTLKTSGRSGSTQVENFSIEDLLDHYGPSLMGVMADQCPVAYDPKRDKDRICLAPTARTLYTAQEHAAKALTQLIQGPDHAAILLGEIGVGKTTVALKVGKTVAHRILTMCPPHLLDTWRDECQAVFPEAEFRVLSTVTDVDNLETVPSDRPLVAVMTREAAKLGHGLESVTGACPKCGAALPPGDLAKKRVHCSAQTLKARGTIAQSIYPLALRLAKTNPNDVMVRQVLEGRFLIQYLDRCVSQGAQQEWEGFDPQWVDSLISEVFAKVCESHSESAMRLLGVLLIADYKPERIANLIRSFGTDTVYYLQGVAQALTLLLPPGSLLQSEMLQCPVFEKQPWTYFNNSFKTVCDYGYGSSIGKIKWTDGELTVNDLSPGSVDLASNLLVKIYNTGKFSLSKECEEPLFQAIPEPRRFPLSKYIARQRPKFFDLFIADEAHEYSTEGAAQEKACHRITALGMPVLYMTGSLMNGYADSLFANMWSIGKNFRREFSREDRSKFVERYGYRERTVSDRDDRTNEVVEYGSLTDRVTRSERITGDAPGILPLFLFRHLLPISVTLHKADLGLELPPCRQIKYTVKADPDLMDRYNSLRQNLISQIRKDQFTPGLAGKLFGALAELPSYLDRSTEDAGNQDDGSYEIRYPEAIGRGLVARVDSFPASKISAKEAKMLETVKSELSEGRNVMVFTWHTDLLARLAKLISDATGETVPILYAEKVPTAKRQDWINKKVVQKGARVLVTNPVCIQTGLNNLVHFATEVWHENPACNPTIFRQGIGRIDRIGQKLETRIYVPVYEGTLQVQLYDLLMRKVTVAISTDGLDPESMLIAAGASSEGYLTGLSIGKQLWEMLNSN